MTELTKEEGEAINKEVAEDKGKEVETNDDNNKNPEETTPDVLEETKQTLEELKQENKQLAENINNLKKIQAETLIRGTSRAGQAVATHEDKVKEEAKKLLDGSGFSID